jgi:hypothetical protein
LVSKVKGNERDIKHEQLIRDRQHLSKCIPSVCNLCGATFNVAKYFAEVYCTLMFDRKGLIEKFDRKNLIGKI